MCVQLDNNPLRGRSACHVAVCVSAWCQRSPVCLPGASWAPTLGTVSIWLSAGACCVPVTSQRGKAEKPFPTPGGTYYFVRRIFFGLALS